MYRACYNLRSVHWSLPDELLVRINAATVMGLAQVNAEILEFYPDTPPIYEYRPRYFVPRVEQWKDVLQVIEDGEGDCKDFVAWRLAELWRIGRKARAESTVERDGRKLQFHTFIRHDNGRVEDPSVALGMR